ncbi:hypothetical protein CE91St62_27450 [Lachnospiraceae bacterium]|uniref:hypothetical protein n=1 Tax=Extibacter sp. GGCC_0201 TaxID=2731209 RepID=UPI001AA0D35F|nr:hypothetical protein [Extibacter sp. GGCC_0201]MBO1720521.1 hypothetical protein [Extibacter sp. GGCC_0201]BDF34682.1 hypothetical protein CE91St61_27570 [Lachnospiraceae bacterium]BDF38684.1 hypothetical protein CE91St62_27450 [Lachnospiraceae bacterium]
MSDRPYPFEKNRYYYGKMLTSADFQAEQRYHDSRRMFLNQLVLGTGVLCGLGVRALDERTLLIESGAAVDGAGRDIVVPGETVKKLAAFEGYDSLTKSTAMLYLKHKEEAVQPVCVVNRRAEQEEYEDNRIRETYEFFLADCPEEEKKGETEEFFAEMVLLDGSDYKVSLKMPAVVCKGRHVRLTLHIKNLSGSEGAVTVKGRLRLPAFLTADGAQELWIRQEEVVLQSGETKRQDYWLYTNEVEYGTTSILWDEEASGIFLDGDEAKCQPKPELALQLTERAPLELVRWNVGRRNLEEKSQGTGETAVCLARIAIADAVHDHILEEVEESDVKRYIPLPQTEDICSEYLDCFSYDGRDIVQPAYAQRREEEVVPVQEEPVLVRGGTLEIPLGLKQKKGKVYCSEEVLHGLGPGPVYVDVGILNVGDGAGRGSTGDTVIYGESGLFEGGSARGISAQTSVKVYESRGSFQVAARLTGEQNTIVLPLRWTAVRIPARPEQGEENKAMQIIPDTPTVRLPPGEKHYFSVRFKNMEPCTLTYELMDEGGGEVGPDGIYTAPARCGIYEIRICCREYKKVCTYVYAVVGGKE